MAGWALRLWNLRRLLAWAACFALAAGSIWSGERYQQSLWEDSNRFNPQTEGLLQVRTVHESDQSIQYNTLASGQRIMNTEAFAAAPFRFIQSAVFSFRKTALACFALLTKKEKKSLFQKKSTRSAMR